MKVSIGRLPVGGDAEWRRLTRRLIDALARLEYLDARLHHLVGETLEWLPLVAVLGGTRRMLDVQEVVGRRQLLVRVLLGGQAAAAAVQHDARKAGAGGAERVLSTLRVQLGLHAVLGVRRLGDELVELLLAGDNLCLFCYVR